MDRRFTLGLLRPVDPRESADLWLALDAALKLPGSIMVVGSRLVADELQRRGHDVTSEDSATAAVRCLAWRRHRAVVVEPSIPGALELIEAIKVPRQGEASAARLHAITPIFVLPFAGEAELWIVFRVPADVLVLDSDRQNLFDVIGWAGD